MRDHILQYIVLINLMIFIQYEEVQNVTWANKEEIHQLIEEGKFIPYCTGFIDLLFFQKDSRGVIEKSNGK